MEIFYLIISFVLAKRGRKSGKKALKINKYNVGISLIILGVIFFFSKYMAPSAPVFEFLSHNASVAFGDLGLVVFFGLCVVMGTLILFKGYLMKTLLKQFGLLMLVVSGILNFPVMKGESPNSVVNWVSSNDYGGYFSWPLIEGLEMIFGQTILAIQVLLVVFALLIFGWILYTLNVKLPSLPKINVEQYDKPQKKAETSKPFITKESKITSDSDLFKKVSQAAGEAFSNGKASSSKSDGSLLKDMLKKKLDEKMSSKPAEAPKPRRQIQFSGDKPTFPYSLLESNLGQTQDIDQNFIVEKAKSLQNKLMEFGIPVSVEGFDIGPSIVQIKIKPSE